MGLQQRASGEPVSGFETLCRFHDPHFRREGVKVRPGEYYVTGRDELVTTILGSCVAACIRDRVLAVGGMNHFLLPLAAGDREPAHRLASARYGNHAMEHLIDGILAHGGDPRNLEVKVFGGARIDETMGAIGQQNIAFILAYLQEYGLPIVARDLGGDMARKVIFFPRSGRVLVKRLPAIHRSLIASADRTYFDHVEPTEQAGYPGGQQ